LNSGITESQDCVDSSQPAQQHTDSDNSGSGFCSELLDAQVDNSDVGLIDSSQSQDSESSPKSQTQTVTQAQTNQVSKIGKVVILHYETEDMC
jgi:hypothetical protein